MGWLLRDNWIGSLLAFVLGAAITWVLLDRRRPATTVPAPPAAESPAEDQVEVLVGATAAPTPDVEQPVFSQVMDGDPTLFDDLRAAAEPEEGSGVPVGRYGEGSADAVPHQGPPDGFTIKGNAHSMLFHTPDSPYYGRTKPEVWFRSEADAERAGFTKYVRRPRKSPNPRD